MVWLHDGVKSLRICLLVSTGYRHVTDRQTDELTSCDSIVHAMHTTVWQKPIGVVVLTLEATNGSEDKRCDAQRRRRSDRDRCRGLQHKLDTSVAQLRHSSAALLNYVWLGTRLKAAGQCRVLEVGWYSACMQLHLRTSSSRYNLLYTRHTATANWLNMQLLCTRPIQPFMLSGSICE